MTVAATPTTCADPHVFLTGATGLVGGAVLCELVLTTAARVTTLVRAADDEHAQTRCRELLTRLFGGDGARALEGRVTAIAGDVEQPLLGLSPSRWQELAEDVTHVCHSAASVRFDLPLAVARRINVDGTRSVLELARRAHAHGRLQRLGYVSTAFVAGHHRKRFMEDDLDVGQRFRNTYERSKFEAELMLRSAMGELPITVVRPSIVMGHSSTGETTAFNVLYVPVRLYVTGRLRRLPTSTRLPIDAVPVDYVAQVIVQAVVQSGRPGVTYAAAAGAGAATAGEVAALASSVFEREPPVFVRLPLVSAATGVLARLAWRRVQRRKRIALLPYVPYMVRGSRFDAANTAALLRPLGGDVPSTATSLRRILEFARDTNFGRDRLEMARRIEVTAEERRRLLRRGAPLPA